MSAHRCHVAYPAATLIEYWLGELAEPVESAFEEHLFCCAECAARLREIADLGLGIRRATRDGHLHGVLTASFIDRLKATGLRVREYRLQPGGSVMCTITPDDDIVVAHLHAPLHEVRRLDVVIDDLTEGFRQRMDDVAFDPASDEVVLAPNSARLREITRTTQRAQLFAVDESGERMIGEYTFNHSSDLRR
jgi:hypothetical protein